MQIRSAALLTRRAYSSLPWRQQVNKSPSTGSPAQPKRKDGLNSVYASVTAPTSPQQQSGTPKTPREKRIEFVQRFKYPIGLAIILVGVSSGIWAGNLMKKHKATAGHELAQEMVKERHEERANRFKQIRQ
ncbi:hypothetical protein GQ42DRAFT_164804 [Ramicandelaber brevisporus]|nr:hypothetical protein GQ42DRAFT_164804 [Ramicandelaber brevisporus]